MTVEVKGHRERIKHAKSMKEAVILLQEVKSMDLPRYYKRCKKVFDQLPFTKEE